MKIEKCPPEGQDKCFVQRLFLRQLNFDYFSAKYLHRRHVEGTCIVEYKQSNVYCSGFDHQNLMDFILFSFYFYQHSTLPWIRQFYYGFKIRNCTVPKICHILYTKYIHLFTTGLFQKTMQNLVCVSSVFDTDAVRQCVYFTAYIHYVDIWFDNLLPKLRPLLYVNGGPIIMVQVS